MTDWKPIGLAGSDEAFVYRDGPFAVVKDRGGAWHAGELGHNAHWQLTCDCSLCPRGHDEIYHDLEVAQAVAVKKHHSQAVHMVLRPHWIVVDMEYAPHGSEMPGFSESQRAYGVAVHLRVCDYSRPSVVRFQTRSRGRHGDGTGYSGKVQARLGKWLRWRDGLGYGPGSRRRSRWG